MANWIFLKRQLMITVNHDLVAMWQLPEPVVEVPDLKRAPAEKCEIPGMDQQITRGDVDLAMQSVLSDMQTIFKGVPEKTFDLDPGLDRAAPHSETRGRILIR
jgi:hypothetical protein